MKRIHNQLNLSKKRLVKSVFGLFSLSTMLFVFQACYGTPQDFGQDFLLEGTVLSEHDQEAIEGIEVSFVNLPQYTSTDAEGKFAIHCPKQDQYQLRFQDTDGTTNGLYSDLDRTVLVEPLEDGLELSILLKKN